MRGAEGPTFDLSEFHFERHESAHESRIDALPRCATALDVAQAEGAVPAAAVAVGEASVRVGTGKRSGGRRRPALVLAHRRRHREDLRMDQVERLVIPTEISETNPSPRSGSHALALPPRRTACPSTPSSYAYYLVPAESRRAKWEETKNRFQFRDSTRHFRHSRCRVGFVAE